MGEAGGDSQVVEDSLEAAFRGRYNKRSRMPVSPPNPGRPGPEDGNKARPQDASISNHDDIPGEIEEKAQPEARDGVLEDMGTLAINPRLLANLEAAENHHA